MFNKSQVEGILLSVAKPEVHISRSQHTNIGYRVRIRVNIRGCEDFLLGVQRTLAQHSIKSKYKENRACTVFLLQHKTQAPIAIHIDIPIHFHLSYL